MPPLPPLALPLTALLRGAGQVFLQGHAGCGLLVLLAIAWGAPHLLGAALLGTLAAWATARLRGYPPAANDAGLQGYNGLLLGLLLGLTFAWTPLLALAIVTSAALSTLLLHRLHLCAALLSGLPAYTLPFVAIGWLLLGLGAPLGLQPLPAVASPLLQLDAATLLAAPFRGLGQAVFLDAPFAGLCLWLGLLWANWRLACWALLGSTCGLLLALLLDGPTSAALAGLHGYNPALAALALSRNGRARCAPLCGIALACLLHAGFTALALPALTAPFILACWLVQTGQRLGQRLNLTEQRLRRP